jgi:hypothetical protein
MSEVRTIPWDSIADWFAMHEQTIRDVMKFEGLRGAVNEVLRLAPDQPELVALRGELAECKQDYRELSTENDRLLDVSCSAEQRNSELLQLAEIAKEWDGSWLPSDFHRRLEALIAAKGIIR